MDVKRGHVYRHYKKGVHYEVLEVAYHTETEERLVIYRARTGLDWRVWARPLSMFTEKVKTEEGEVPRFTLVAEPKGLLA